MKVEPTYEKDTVLLNKHTGSRYKLLEPNYDKRLMCIVWKAQNVRYKFDMFELPEPVIRRNLDKGKFKYYDKK